MEEEFDLTLLMNSGARFSGLPVF